MADAVDYNAKWDACLDLTLRRFVYSSLAGAFGGLLLFRSPVTRWASIAFAAGVGVGSAYTECSQILYGSPGKLSSPKVLDTPAPQLLGFEPGGWRGTCTSEQFDQMVSKHGYGRPGLIAGIRGWPHPKFITVQTFPEV